MRVIIRSFAAPSYQKTAGRGGRVRGPSWLQRSGNGESVLGARDEGTPGGCELCHVPVKAWSASEVRPLGAAGLAGRRGRAEPSVDWARPSESARTPCSVSPSVRRQVSRKPRDELARQRRFATASRSCRECRAGAYVVPFRSLERSYVLLVKGQPPRASMASSIRTMVWRVSERAAQIRR